MPDKQEIIDYKGVLSFGDISDLLNLLKERLDSMGEKLVTYKRIIILMVEVLENIKKYIDSNIDDAKVLSQNPTLFDLNKVGNTFFLTGKNIIRVEHRKKLEDKINLVNSMDSNELRNLYRQVISNGQFSVEGGAGLGFIELAKTSENKLKFSFEKIDEKFFYYSITLELTC